MKKSEQSEFKCEICMEDFDSINRKPNSLVPCGHTFCIICLEHIGSSKCPTCRSDFTNFIPNWEIIKRLNNTHIQQHVSGPPSSQPQTSQASNSDNIRTCCTNVSSHFYALSTKRKLLFIYTLFIALPVLLIYPVALLYVGIQHVYNECKINYLIPVWMVVYGGDGILTVVLGVLLALFLILKFPNAKVTYGIISFSAGLVAFFEVIWFFIGTVWVFSAYSKVSYDDSTMMTNPNYCQPTLFKFAFGTLVAQCIVFGILVCLSPCILCCCWSKLGRNKR